MSQLDSTYNCRINDTAFITELVLEFGFKFTRGEQDYDWIRELVISKANVSERDAFRKGLNVYKDFIGDLEKYLFESKNISAPSVSCEKPQDIIKKKKKQAISKQEGKLSLSINETLNIGWLGEAYLYSLIKSGQIDILNALGINEGTSYEVNWFNKGYNEAEQVYEGRNPKHLELVRKWDDKSVGHGCDLIVKTADNINIFIEVKTSKRTAPIFVMTMAELVKMEEKKDKYFLVKINNIERLLYHEKPDVTVYQSPFDIFFHPNRIKDATFYLRG